MQYVTLVNAIFLFSIKLTLSGTAKSVFNFPTDGQNASSYATSNTEDQGVDGRKILKWSWEKAAGLRDVVWTGSRQKEIIGCWNVGDKKNFFNNWILASSVSKTARLHNH